jgi:Fe-S-cluster containining protein
MKTVVSTYDQIDAMTDKAVEEFGPAACSTCRKPTCCWQKVDAYDSEMKQVARAIEDNEPAKARVRQWAQSFVLLPRAVQVAPGAYFKLHRPCPFLVAGRCSIYAIRPVACRTHFSFSESPRDCDPDEVGHGYPVKNLDVAHVNLALLGMEPSGNFILGVLQNLEPDSVLGKMARAIDQAIRREEMNRFQDESRKN